MEPNKARRQPYLRHCNVQGLGARTNQGHIVVNKLRLESKRSGQEATAQLPKEHGLRLSHHPQGAKQVP
jgi:hypothetical protein